MGVKRGLWRYVENVVWRCLKKSLCLEKYFILKGKNKSKAKKTAQICLRLTYCWTHEMKTCGLRNDHDMKVGKQNNFGGISINGMITVKYFLGQ